MGVSGDCASLPLRRVAGCRLPPLGGVLDQRDHHGGAVLTGREGPWPFAGYFRGSMDAAHGAWLSWAGRVDAGVDPVAGWKASRAVVAALQQGGPIDAERRRALSILWDRLDAVDRAALGEAGGADLSLLLVARDAHGASVSGVGLGAVFTLEEGGEAQPWVTGEHPLLGPPGLPRTRPGALSVDSLCAWVLAVPAGEAAQVEGLPLAQVLAHCGVHP